ncbi:glucose 1-dehydrogenase [Frankia sp. AgB32]|uniref:glucose 1-dehydrogenase n=1 Tax=Frankia sp. AgB32 TaxID=631119 RepID=UPI00200CC828|nr:glucose 1-dehydrogenase [Frankia sp. AgB32]MCK9896428.1 glucose 1-dehydrogenase [Frankia sp. AgB32]
MSAAGGRLAGKVAIITGAARGMGAQEARLFAAEGARVVLADVRDDLAAEVAKELGDDARARHHDVAQAASWADVMAYTLAEFGRLDVLVNNAAVHHLGTIETETDDGFDKIIAVNLRGTFLGIRAAIEPMRASGGGSIINISSTAGLQPYWAHGAYAASKFGVTGLTQVSALELGPHGIRVNSVHPGPIATDMLPTPENSGRFDSLPVGRVGQPNEVAEAVLFLASDASSYVSGTQLKVDGGEALGRIPQA